MEGVSHASRGRVEGDGVVARIGYATRVTDRDGRNGERRDAAREGNQWGDEVGAVGVEADITLAGDGCRLACEVDRSVTRDLEGGHRDVSTVFDVDRTRGDVTGDGRNRLTVNRAIGVARSIVHRRDGDVEVTRLGQGTIGDRIGDDWDRAVPVQDRREGVAAIGIDGQRTLVIQGDRLASGINGDIAGDRELRDGKLGVGVIDVRVVRQDIARRGRIFVRGASVVDGVRRIVDWVDGQDEGLGDDACRRRVAVGSLEGDRIQRAVPVGERREGIGTRSGDGQVALTSDGCRLSWRVDRIVTRDREFGDRDGLVFHVGSAGEHVPREGRVFVARAGSVGDDRVIVDGVDGDGERAGCRRKAIGHRELDDRQGAVPVAINRREGIRAVGIKLERPLTRDDHIGTEGLIRAIDLQGARDDGKRLVGVVVRIIGVDRGIDDRSGEG